jgi:hypothetical protein
MGLGFDLLRKDKRVHPDGRYTYVHVNSRAILNIFLFEDIIISKEVENRLCVKHLRWCVIMR